MPTSVHNAPVGTDSRTPNRVLWLNGLIVATGTFAVWAGADRLTLDNFAPVLTYIGLVLAIVLALLLYVNRQTGERLLWLNGLIVGIGGVVGMAGVDRLVVTVESFAYVLAYLGLVLAVQIALLLCVKRRTGAPAD